MECKIGETTYIVKPIYRSYDGVLIRNGWVWRRKAMSFVDFVGSVS